MGSTNLRKDGSAEVIRDLIFSVACSHFRRAFIFCSPIYPTPIWKIYMTRGDLCEVNIARNDYVWLSNPIAPLLTR